MDTEITQTQLEGSKLYKKYDTPERQATEDDCLRKFMLSARKARHMAKQLLGR